MKNIEETLRESQVTLDVIVNSTSDLIWAVDCESFGILWSNNSFQDFFLQERHIQIKPGMRAEDLFPTQDHIQLWNALFQRALAEGPYTTEYRAYTGVTLFQLSFNLLKKDGEVFGISVFGKDISEQTRTEAALRESEQRFRQMFESHSAVMLLIEPESGAIMDANPAAVDFYGYSRDQLTHLFTHDINMMSPDKVAEASQKTKSKQRDQRIFPHRLANGEICTVEVHSSPITVHGQLLLFSIIQDVTKRQQTQEQLEVLKHSIDTALDAAFWMDKNGHFVYVNEAACKSLGYTREELLQMRVSDVAPRVTPERWRQIWEQLKKNKNRISESLHRRKDGSEFPVDVTSTYVQFEGQEYCNGFAKDITERKQAEEKLRQSEALYRQAIEVSGAVPYLQSFSEVGSEVVYDFIGDGIRQITGYGPEEFSDKLWDSLTLKRVAVEELAGYPWSEAVRRVRSGENSTWKCEYCIRARDGKIRWVSEAAVELRDEHGVSRGSIGFFQDITRRKQSEEQIEQQFKRLNGLRRIDTAIISSFDLWVTLDIVLEQVLLQLEVDASAVLLYDPYRQTIEHAASRGFHSDSMLTAQFKWSEGYAGRVLREGKTIHISGLMQDSGQLSKALHLTDEGFVEYYGIPLIAKGETHGVLEVYHRSRLHPKEGWLEFLEMLAGQAAIAIDNSLLFDNLQRSNLDLEQRVAERTMELNRTNAELEHANHAKDEFLANMSHELRTPLNSILGLSESLLEQRRGSLNESQQRSLQIIASSGGHLLALINDILDLSKIEAGKFDCYPEFITIDEVCTSSLAFVKSQAMKKSITVLYNNQASVSQICADPRRLKQILVNLLTNAVKFTPEHGQVILRASSDAENGFVQFSVTDNGIGIAPEDLKQLFQPFVQVSSGNNRQYEGTGLGLALVQKLTDLHGGSVQVESEAGKGSCFMINLPWDKEMFPPRSIPADAELLTPSIVENKEISSEGHPKRGTVLLAEDNMPNILTIGEYLEGHGYEVIVAHNGVEALEQAETVHPDIILMDVQMPAMDGLEATRRLRVIPRFASTPIIALTALAMPGDRERCLAAGANEYMSKPVNLKSLVKLIDDLLERKNT